MTSENPVKKGRPTPKRKDAQAKVRTSSLSPANTKEEKARQKAASRQARVAQRAALMRGEESALPARDKGPVRKFTRNYVDSRHTVGEYFLPLIGVVLIVSIIPQPIFAVIGIIVMYSALAFSVIDGFFLARAVKARVAEKFPDASTKGLGFYAWLRSTQMRRLRTPKPQVKRGAKDF